MLSIEHSSMTMTTTTNTTILEAFTVTKANATKITTKTMATATTTTSSTTTRTAAAITPSMTTTMTTTSTTMTTTSTTTMTTPKTTMIENSCDRFSQSLSTVLQPYLHRQQNDCKFFPSSKDPIEAFQKRAAKMHFSQSQNFHYTLTNICQQQKSFPTFLLFAAIRRNVREWLRERQRERERRYEHESMRKTGSSTRIKKTCIFSIQYQTFSVI